MPRNIALVLIALVLAAMGVLAVMAALWPRPAMAQQPCGPMEKLVEHLASHYREAQVAAGDVDNGNGSLFFFANPKTGTWTMGVLKPSGLVCLIASGTHWRPVAYSEPGEKT